MESQKACNLQGAELPLPTSAKENEELAKIFATQNLAGSGLGVGSFQKLAAFWLRTDDVATEGTFVDSKTNVKIDYFNWALESPNNWKNGNVGQDHVIMFENGQWNDMGTYAKAHTVCQKKIMSGNFKPLHQSNLACL